MRKILLSVFIMVLALQVSAQAPKYLNYQSILRSSAGELISNQDVSLRINIIEGSISGSTVFSEIQDVTTNKFGLVSFLIGGGNINFGSFDNIDWGSNSHFVNIELDAEGGSNYIDMGTTQLVSVPYALYAETAGNMFFNKAVSSNEIYYNGGVGIGTTDPQKALHVRRINETGNTRAQIMIESTLESSAMLVLGYYPDETYTSGEGSIWNVMTYKVGGDFAIGEETDNIPGGVGNENRLLIQKETGNVGIGVDTPKRKLHVSEAVRMEPQATAPENPAMGDMYFGTDGKLHLYNGTGWYTVNMTAE